MNTITDMSLTDIIYHLERKDFSRKELTIEYIKNIEKDEAYTNAFITTCKEAALENAVKQDLHPSSPLGGIPIAVKDNICTQGIKTTCGSAILKDYIPPYDAAAVECLKKAGMSILGKTNMDEFGMGDTGENSAFGITRNPVYSEHTPGGSSSGSAAAVAACQAPISLGSDTGGSVRLPASYCGLVGLKPSYGAISRYGLVSFAPSLDVVGIISKKVEDCRIMLDLLSSNKKQDMTADFAFNNTARIPLDRGLKGIKICIPNCNKELSKHNLRVLEEVKNVLLSLGCEVEYRDLPIGEQAIAAYYMLACSEAASNLARFDGIRYGAQHSDKQTLEELYIKTRSEGFGQEVKKRIMLGNYAISRGEGRDYYINAQRARKKLTHDYKRILGTCHAVLLPTSFLPYIDFDQTRSGLDKFCNDKFNIIANLGGFPSVTLPVLKENGCSLSVQLMGDNNNDWQITEIAKVLEGVVS